ncbi:MAG: ATP-binding cassette domain-containing protein [Clostridiales Family XIII bacterium]|jgi:ABC-type glutathione transport system ATPase component|nr:ATP-binding cassette domain-containing protein [Clostridiales Family XIII bacterium]
MPGYNDRSAGHGLGADSAPGKLLEVKDVSNTYVTHSRGIFGGRKEKSVLSGVSFDVNRGEIFGIVGESGCGKSTLGRAILGVIDYRGEILIGGRVRQKKNRRELARKVQAIFQDPTGSLNPTKHVGWLMEEPLKIHRIGSRSERERRVDETLDLIGLDSSYKSRSVHELSGGQKQRVCIGSALMLEPDLIIADEAVSALDVSIGAQILNLFRELHERLGLSLIFISHNLDVVYYLCDRIAVMNGGQIVEENSAEEIYQNPQHEYTKTLLAAIPKISA